MKKILAFFGLLLVAVLGLVGCGKETPNPKPDPDPVVVPDDPSKPDEFFKLTLPSGVESTAQDNEKIKKGESVTILIDVPKEHELKSLLVNGVEKKGEVSNNKLTIQINENTTVEVSFKKIGGDTQDPEGLLSIADFKALKDETPGKTKGVVIAKGTSGREGFYVADDSGVLFVYRLNDDTFKVGDLVQLEGTKTSFYNVIQMGENAKITVLDENQKVMPYEKMTIEEILALDPLPSLGKLVEFSGMVKEKQGKYTDYYITTFDDPTKDVKVYFKSNEPEVKKYVGKAITVKAVIHDWHNDDKYFTVFVPVGKDYVKRYLPPATDLEKISKTQEEVNSVIPEKVYFDIPLRKTGELYEDVLVTYNSSSESILTKEGVVTRPDLDTKVTLTITYTCDSETKQETKELTIKAKNTTGYHTFEEFYAMPDQHEAKIKGQVYQSGRSDLDGYFITDGSLNILVYGSNQDVKVGQEVVITGKKQFYGKYTEQLIYDSKENIEVLSENNPSIATYEEISYSDLLKLEPSSTNLNKNYVTELIVDKRSIDFVTEAFAIDPYTLEDGGFTYRSNKDQILSYDQKIVKIEVVTYMFDQDGKVEIYYGHHEGGIVEIPYDSSTISDEKRLESAKSYLERIYQDYEVTIPTIKLVKNTKYFNLPITWQSSDNAVIDPSTGAVDLKENKDIKLTATITSGAKSLDVEINVKVKKVLVKTILSVLDDLRQKITGEVTVRGIVVATRGYSGFFLKDDTGIIYVKSNPNGFVSGDEVFVTGPSITNKSSEFQIDSPKGNPNKQALISKDNEYDLTPIKVTKDNMDELIPTIHQKYVEVTAVPYEVGSGFRKTIELYVGGDQTTGRKVLIHNASNKNGILLAGETPITLRGFAFRVFDKQDPKTFTLFFTNIEGEKEFANKEDKFKYGFEYVLNVLPDSESTLTANLALPPYHTLDHTIKYIYTSSDETLLTNEGILGGKDSEQEVTLTIAIQIGDEIQEKTINYKVAPKQEAPRDLVFTFVSRGVGFNKIFAIYNGTGKDVDLSSYKVVSLQNAGVGGYGMLQKTTNVQSKIELTGTLPNGKTLVIYNSKTDAKIKNQIPADVMKLEANQTVAEFNCKDADLIYLVHNTQIIDRIGTFIGVPSQGASAAWEEQIIDQKMVIRKRECLTNSNINWNDLDKVRENYEIYPVKDATENYLMPSILWDYKDGAFPS